VLHAPRQTGKTTCLLALMAHLHEQSDYRALYANIEPAQAWRNNIPEAMRTICYLLARGAQRDLNDNFMLDQAEVALQQGAGQALPSLLSLWAQQSQQPIVLFLDEVDALVGDTLISVLRQIRGGYAQRPVAFPISIILCSVRDVRDYRIQSGGKDIITGGSAFNIKTTSLHLGNFTRQEVETLWLQHTQETGQSFAEKIFPELWQDTCGQP